MLLLLLSCSVASRSCEPMDCSTTQSSVLHCLPAFVQIHVYCVSDASHLILCHLLLLLSSVFPSIRVFLNDSALHIRWPKYWSFSFSNSSSNEYSGLVSFRIDWSDLLAVQGVFKSFLQHHSSKHHFFGTQPSLGPTLTSIHNYWKNHSFDYTDLCW